MPMLVYDGECNFCIANVKLLQSLPGADRIHFVALQGGEAQAQCPDVDWERAKERMHYVRTDGVVADGPAAIALVLEELGGPAKLAARALQWPAAKAPLEAAYDAVARNRHRILGRKKRE